jgi:hypothetical protein
MRGLWMVAAAAIVAGCDGSVEPTSPAEVETRGAVNAKALFEQAWGGDGRWEMVKPRPPGLGVSVEKATELYVIAPVSAFDPLSPPVVIPGIVTLGGRDHVVPTPAGGAGSFSGVARTVALEVPGWMWFLEPFCAPPADNPRIAWDWIEISGPGGHPCGGVAAVYAVQLDGEECLRPLTSVARVEAAIAQGLAAATYPPGEGAWPFSIRPITSAGAGREMPAAPSECVASGAR